MRRVLIPVDVNSESDNADTQFGAHERWLALGVLRQTAIYMAPSVPGIGQKPTLVKGGFEAIQS